MGLCYKRDATDAEDESETNEQDEAFHGFSRQYSKESRGPVRTLARVQLRTPVMPALPAYASVNPVINAQAPRAKGVVR